MFGLLKLAAYGLIGYAIYEFFRGLTTEREQMGRHFQRHPLADGVRDFVQHEIEDRHSAPRRQPQGNRVSSQQPDGGTASHVVGRGVVSR